MDLSQIMTFIESLEETWLGTVFLGFASAIPFCLIICVFITLSHLVDSVSNTRLRFLLTKYVEYSLLCDYPEYVQAEKSAKWLDKVRLWFIRNGYVTNTEK